MDNLKDLQSSSDSRNIYINQVGINNYTYPVFINENQTIMNTIVKASVHIDLPASQRGIHMSRIIEQLEKYRTIDFLSSISIILEKIKEVTNSKSVYCNYTFQYFKEKMAPITKYKSLTNYLCSIEACHKNSKNEIYVTIFVPITSVCPCSKEISEYGAHNQRGIIKVKVLFNKQYKISDIITLAENAGSSEIYSLLKRPDEKYVTEHGYENAKFVEDIARDLVLSLEQKKLKWLDVSVENFESIHNHNAFALIQNNCEV